MSRFDSLPPDQPFPLKDICEIIFENRITPATLKAEHARENLELFKIGRQYFTTRRHVEAMIEKCRLSVPPSRSKLTALAVVTGHAHMSAALASARQIAEKLKARAGRENLKS